MQENIIVDQGSLNFACMAVPWLVICGFLLVYAPLLVMTHRIYQLFSNRRMAKMAITNKVLLTWEVLGSLPVLGLLVFWQIYDPMIWVRSTVATDSSTGLVIATAGLCAANNLEITLVPILVFLGLGIVAGIYMAWLTRNAPTEYSQGRYISANIVMLSEALILGVPIIILSSSNPVSRCCCVPPASWQSKGCASKETDSIEI